MIRDGGSASISGMKLGMMQPEIGDEKGDPQKCNPYHHSICQMTKKADFSHHLGSLFYNKWWNRDKNGDEALLENQAAAVSEDKHPAFWPSRAAGDNTEH